MVSTPTTMTTIATGSMTLSSPPIKKLENDVEKQHHGRRRSSIELMKDGTASLRKFISDVVHGTDKYGHSHVDSDEETLVSLDDGEVYEQIELSARFNRRPSIDPREQEQINQMLSELSDDELEAAARSNYEYLKQSSGGRKVIKKDDDENRKMYHASEMAKRYLRSKKDPKIALSKMLDTIRFRSSIDVDGLRLAFEPSNSSSDQLEGNKASHRGKKYSKQLREQLESKMVYVQGYDKAGRATYIFEPHRVQTHDMEWTIKQHVWTLEKAIACSKSNDKSVNAVVNFGGGFSVTKHAPPIDVGKQFMKCLRSHYTGHINSIFLVDAPAAFFLLWKVFKPFVGSSTRDKIHFVSSPKQKKDTIGKLYTQDQAMPWMLPGGLKDELLDLDTYLATPFNQI